MARPFRYLLEPARTAALAHERIAGLAFAQAREAESRCVAAQRSIGLGAPAALFALQAAAASEARLRVLEARAVLEAALRQRLRFDADRAARRRIFARDVAREEERRRYEDSACSRGARGAAFETPEL
jgi:hypothetical protein